MKIRTAVFAAALVSTAATGCMSGDEGVELGTAEAALTQGALAGGGGGVPYHADITDERIVGITVWEDNEVDGMDVFYERANGTEHKIHIGGYGGVKNPRFEIHDDEELIGISGRAGARIDQIQFHLSGPSPRSSLTYGGNGGTRFSRFIAAGAERVVGFYGRHGSRVDAIVLAWEP